ncbi:hypothetical protein [Fusobacterium necrophorum]|uniref:hypothetical protein n=1 Tax=Fusobacterium necrophorum TaxID=859 RepID=UPI00370E1B10
MAAKFRYMFIRDCDRYNYKKCIYRDTPLGFYCIKSSISQVMLKKDRVDSEIFEMIFPNVDDFEVKKIYPGDSRKLLALLAEYKEELYKIDFLAEKKDFFVKFETMLEKSIELKKPIIIGVK